MESGAVRGFLCRHDQMRRKDRGDKRRRQDEDQLKGVCAGRRRHTGQRLSQNERVQFARGFDLYI